MPVEARLVRRPSLRERILLRVDQRPVDDALPEPVDVEAEESDDDAPWVPVPTRQGQQFLDQNPEAALNVVFPTVYEEDRTAKIKDLATVNMLGAITHQRMAEQLVKELGVEDYDYQSEQDQIKKELKTLPPSELGVGDQIAQRVVGLGPKAGAAGGGGPTYNFGQPAGGLAADRNGDAPQHRDDLSGVAQVRFRKLQRQSARMAESFALLQGQHQAERERGARLEALVEHQSRQIDALLKVVTEAARPAPVAPPAEPQPITVTAPPPALPFVEVALPPARRIRRTIERDADGRAIALIDEPEPEGDAHAS